MTHGQDLTLSTPQQETANSAVDLWSNDDPRAMINLLTDVVKESILSARDRAPELFERDMHSLYKELGKRGAEPSPTDNRLRLSFWQEYDKSQANGKSMQMSAVFTGICSKQFFYGHYLKSSEKVAWLCSPPASYTTIMEEALSFGIEQLRDILEISHKDAKGNLNVKLLELKAKIVAMLDMRVKGAVVQKIEQKSMSLNVNTSDKAVASQAMLSTMEDIQRRMKELDKREREALNLPPMERETIVIEEKTSHRKKTENY